MHHRHVHISCICISDVWKASLADKKPTIQFTQNVRIRLLSRPDSGTDTKQSHTQEHHKSTVRI